MSVDSVLARGREFAEARMTSTATIYRQNLTRTTQDESTGLEVPAWDVVYSDLPFRLKGGAQRGISIGGVDYSEAAAEGHMPALDPTAYDEVPLALADNDYVDLTAGENAGSAYRIVEAVKGDQRTARRVPVVEVSRPAEWP